MRKFIVAALALASFAIAVPAHAQVFSFGPVDKSTKITFSAPIALPGVALPAGTYLFRMIDRNHDSVAQVLNEKGTAVYAATFVIPVTRDEAKEDTEITFREVAADAPPEVHQWFFADSRDGVEFLYWDEKPN